MFRNAAFIAACAAILLAPAVSVQAAQYGTAEEAKAMLERAAAAVKEDKAKALDMFNKGPGKLLMSARRGSRKSPVGFVNSSIWPNSHFRLVSKFL